MPSFKSIAEIEKYLKNKINNALNEEVAKMVKTEEQTAIQQTVYDAYIPTVYHRRKNNGGLIDKRNIKHVVTDGILVVTNETPLNPVRKADGSYYNNAFPDGYGLAEIVEGGYGGLMGTMFGDAMPPRPFTKRTKETLADNKKHVKALKKGLKRQGINAE